MRIERASTKGAKNLAVKDCSVNAVSIILGKTFISNSLNRQLLVVKTNKQTKPNCEVS